MYKVIVFNPSDQNLQVKEAMFKAGAGQVGNYENCCFEMKGQGQFRPLKGSQPFLGEENKLEIVEEIRVEMICPEDKIKKVIQAMKDAHPYEEVAYDVIKLEEL